MGNFIKKLIQFMLVAYLVLTAFKGIDTPDNILYLIASLFLFAMGIFLSVALLRFLTIRVNFLTTFVMSSLISFGIFFLLKEFMTGMFIETYTFEGLNSGSIIINSFEMTPILTMGAGAVIISFISSILNVLEKSS
ncbi:MAG: hypothetical protein UR84_C0006G0003 [candidate division WS6 bacterium GW2011_GWD1_35_594]|uniref:Uncharacterized protein n=2 Tax=Candidatus Dojkabacteria TaxID=74243 RepID=A0A0G0AV38_9BACT|nr:MAG: hypothetical protein UR47_C0003G0002 [candidate division WS6 bacterium GW2011_GWB1_33_6]KKP82189.1 MAG: hypothetical protein UR84_C0006G0003 [candidate division WS6 bacterium GW2011_GWD1_35_594]OGC37225.1 MAG: hypothetical protein A2436_00835 [candidate division WS6 bacterium RIFOXYC1_FULL_33_9]